MNFIHFKWHLHQTFDLCLHVLFPLILLSGCISGHGGSSRRLIHRAESDQFNFYIVFVYLYIVYLFMQLITEVQKLYNTGCW